MKRYFPGSIIAFIAVLVGTLVVGGSVAYANINFNNSSINGDASGLILDSSSTISIGTSSATAIIIGASGQTTTFPGSISITGSLSATGSGRVNATQLQSSAIATSSPSGGQCLVYSTSTNSWAPGSCGGGGGGANSVVNNPSATSTQTIVPSSDITPLTVNCKSGGSSDCFDVNDNGGNLAFGVQANGNLSFEARSLNLGSNGQTGSASQISIFGGTSPTAGPAIVGQNNVGGNQTYLYFDPNTAGAACLNTGATSGSCLAANLIMTATSTNTVANKTFANFFDIATTSAPSNPAAGKIRVYADATTGNLTCLTSSGGSCLATGGAGNATQLQGNTVASTTPSGGNCLVYSSSTNSWTPSSCAGSASTAWSSLSNPISSVALSMGNTTTTFTWDSATGANVNPFSITDSSNNSGTGSLVNINTAAGSSLFPLTVTASGTANGIRISTSGVLAAIGAGQINATQLQSLTIATSSPSSGQCLVYSSSTNSWAPGSCGGSANATQLQGVNISSTAPTTNQVLMYDGTNWSPAIGIGTRLYNTSSGVVTAAIGTTTMATTGSSDANYEFSAYVTQNSTGTNCTGNATVSLKLIYTDPVSALAQPMTATMLFTLGSGSTQAGVTLASSTMSAGDVGSVTYFFRAKTATTISYITGYVNGTGCTVQPAYVVFPSLKQQF
ncbi:MAG TPA: hypothetical protein VMU07_00285 [Candidatus Paceibacterota bacterium]|nr:hypothetical protein [Candidatus Paceibacterota bacterium]